MSSSDDNNEHANFTPPRVVLRQFDPNSVSSITTDTECLVDCWHALERSAVDAAIMSSSERNIFAFAEGCIYLATVHDLDFQEKKAERMEKEHIRKLEEEEKEKKQCAQMKASEGTQKLMKRWLGPVLKNGPTTSTPSVNSFDVASHITPFTFGNEINSDPLLNPVGGGSPARNDAARFTFGNQTTSSPRTNIFGGEIPPHNDAGPFTFGIGIGNAQETATIAYGDNAADDWASDLDDILHEPQGTADTGHPSTATTTGTYPTLAPEFLDEQPSVNDPTIGETDLIGIAYLALATGHASASSEVFMGVALLPHARGKGFGTETTRQLLAVAFDSLAFHRVSASVLGPSPAPPPPPPSNISLNPAPINSKSQDKKSNEEQDSAFFTEADTEAVLRMLVGIGFTMEGLRRRAVQEAGPCGGWRDVYYLAMLDTEWLTLERNALLRSSIKGKGKANAGLEVPSKAVSEITKGGRRTRWDEMLARHQREQEALARTETRLRRSGSTETLRPGVETRLIDIGGGGASEFGTSDAMSTSASEAGECERGRSMSPASTYASSSALNPFQSGGAWRRLGPRVDFFSGESEGSESEAEYGGGEETARRKVTRFLREHPEPGPPPSETGSVKDSDDEFGSCVDPDEVDLLRDAYAYPQDGASYNVSGLRLDETQVRKKRRLSGTGDHSAPTTSSPVSPPSTSPFPTSTSLRANRNSPLPVLARIPRDAENDMELDSDAETATSWSTSSSANSASTWDVLSRGEARSPSPTPSLESGTGSLSLHSVSDGDGE